MAEISQTRIQECRRAAHGILDQLHVEAPDEIDLETIAWKVGKLEIQYGGLKNCDGRIIANSSGGGRIRVRDSGSRGRQRFTIAHEIGHFVLHPSPQIDKDDGPSQFTMCTTRGRRQRQTSSQPSCLCPSFSSQLRLRRGSRALRSWTVSVKNLPQVFWRPPFNTSTTPMSRLRWC
jgi:hypothetical protein